MLKCSRPRSTTRLSSPSCLQARKIPLLSTPSLSRVFRRDLADGVFFVVVFVLETEASILRVDSEGAFNRRTWYGGRRVAGR